MSTPLSTNAKAKATDDDLGGQIEALRADLARLATTAGNNVTDGVADAGRRIEQGGRDARVSASAAVVDHPLASIAIAAGFGFLLGMITRKA